jgi:carbonic anhydrase
MLTSRNASCRRPGPNRVSSRRTFLTTTAAACSLMPAAVWGVQLSPHADSALTKDERDRMKPDEILEELKRGNQRFRSGKPATHDYLNQQHTSAAGQCPAVAFLGCVDSRTPAEIIFDTGIGDGFNARVAGNIVNDDLIGSLEFACAAAGAKVVVLFGHTACGAIKGAIDGVDLGHLTGLLARVKPAISATTFTGEKSSKNAAYVDAVARTNVLLGIETLRKQSPILGDLEKKHALLMVGAMYDLATGAVDFIS